MNSDWRNVFKKKEKIGLKSNNKYIKRKKVFSDLSIKATAIAINCISFLSLDKLLLYSYKVMNAFRKKGFLVQSVAIAK